VFVLIFIIIVIAIFIIDQLSKKYINKKYIEGKPEELVEGKVYIYNCKNEGAAFGFLKDKPILLKIASLSSLVSLIYSFISALAENKSFGDKLSLSFILGGSLGNLYDRFKKGRVTDFIYIDSKKIKNSPVFNFADVFIAIGTIIYLLKSIFGKKCN